MESNYPENQFPTLIVRRVINDAIIDKHLKEDHPCMDAVERFMLRLTPYWNISIPRFKKNLVGMLRGEW